MVSFSHATGGLWLSMTVPLRESAIGQPGPLYGLDFSYLTSLAIGSVAVSRFQTTGPLWGV